jgi:hypothetical protein
MNHVPAKPVTFEGLQYTLLSHITARALPVTQMRTSDGGGTGAAAAIAERRAAEAVRSCIASSSGTSKWVVTSVHVTTGADEGSAEEAGDDGDKSPRTNLAACA